MTIHADGFVMLGKTRPEARADGREFICSAGYQPDLGLIRIYPLARRYAPARWSQTRVALQRNPKDPRKESWQLAGDRSVDTHPLINREVFTQAGPDVPPSARGDLIPERFYVDSVSQANTERRSLALLRPDDAEIIWTRPDRRDEQDMHQLELLSLSALGGAAPDRPDRIPRLRFTDGTEHRLQLRDWGVYELIRKHGLDYAADNLTSALHLDGNSVLLIGNILRHQTSWLVISVLSLTSRQMQLPIDEPVLADVQAGAA